MACCIALACLMPWYIICLSYTLTLFWCFLYDPKEPQVPTAINLQPGLCAQSLSAWILRGSHTSHPVTNKPEQLAATNPLARSTCTCTRPVCIGFVCETTDQVQSRSATKIGPNPHLSVACFGKSCEGPWFLTVRASKDKLLQSQMRGAHSNGSVQPWPKWQSPSSQQVVLGRLLTRYIIIKIYYHI